MRKRNTKQTEKSKTKTIYKVGKSGSVLTLFMEVEGSKYRSVTGILGEEPNYSAWRQAKPKNIGKRSETTAEEQAWLEASAKIDVKLGMGYSDSPDSAEVKTSTKLLCTLAHKWEDHKHRMKDKEMLVSFKLDGMRCLATKHGLFSRNGKPITSCPHVEQALAKFFEDHPSKVLDGELYNHEHCHDFNKIIGALKRQNCDAGLSFGIKFHVFDWYDQATVGKFGQPVFSERYAQLFRWVKVMKTYTDSVETVRQTKLETGSKEEQSLSKMMETALSSGYEGLMIRDDKMPYIDGRTGMLLKFKQFDDAEFSIVEVLEGEGARSEMAGKVLCRVTSGETSQEFEVGIKGGFDFYKQLWKDKDLLVGKSATIRYQNLTPRGVPRFGVLVAIRDYE